jgi:hypothetical protein
MKDKRIRIVAKERQALDIGKFVLALVGIAGVPNPAAQLSLQLDDERRVVAKSVGKTAMSGASEGAHSVREGTQRAANELSEAQLPLPLGLDGQEGAAS